MFNGKTLPPLPAITSDDGWAAGFIYYCQQSALMFGHDRKVPSSHRPVIEVKKAGAYAAVLPCTSKNHSADPEFFELAPPNTVMWTKPGNQTSYASRRYERVPLNALTGGKIGAMPHPARIQLMDWLKARI
jgi:hypothetical protein